jgi:hypothetical protein
LVDTAPNIGCAPGAEIHGERPARLDGGVLHLLQDGPGLYRHGAGLVIDMLNRFHSFQADSDLIGRTGDAVYQAGQTAVGNNRLAPLVT